LKQTEESTKEEDMLIKVATLLAKQKSINAKHLPAR